MPNDPPAPEPTESQPRSKRRRWLAVMAIGLGLLPFLMLEAGLRLLDVGAFDQQLHSGFGQSTALFELDAKGNQYRTSVSMLEFFVHQEFPASKPKQEFRIFVLGGSTVQGRPFSTETAFPKWMELQLQAADPDRTYRTINCGGISYASYRLRPVLREVLAYQPDLIILATGHNEFLEDRTYTSIKSRSKTRLWLEATAGRLRTVQALTKLTGGTRPAEPQQNSASDQAGGTVEARLDDEAGYASYHRDAAWRAQVQQQFSDSVREMLDMCEGADVPLVLVKLGSNLRDCPPFKSELPSTLSVDKQQHWQTLFGRATKLQDSDVQAALLLYQQCLNLDAEHALVHFRIARCLQDAGQTVAAKAAYQQALDQDVCPLRMTSALQKELQQLAAQAQVPLVDAEAAVEGLANQHHPPADDAATGTPVIAGYDLYLDHVHPTIGGHQAIAEAIVAECARSGLIAASVQAVHNKAGNRILRKKHLNQLPVAWFSNGRRRIGWLESWAQRHRLLDEVTPRDLRSSVDALVRMLELSDLPEARTRWQQIQDEPQVSALMLQRSAALFAEGQTAAAAWIVRQLQDLAPSSDTEAGLLVAQLVLAVDTNQPKVVATLLQRDAEQWAHRFAQDTSGWFTTMPDVLARAQALTQPSF